jgi:hypothetical protein
MIVAAGGTKLISNLVQIWSHLKGFAPTNMLQIGVAYFLAMIVAKLLQIWSHLKGFPSTKM